jgi:hypothetical protein
MYARDIVEAFGGINKMARTCGFPVATVQYWKSRNKIPEWRWDKIKQVAQLRNIEININKMEISDECSK